MLAPRTFLVAEMEEQLQQFLKAVLNLIVRNHQLVLLLHQVVVIATR